MNWQSGLQRDLIMITVWIIGLLVVVMLDRYKNRDNVKLILAIVALCTGSFFNGLHDAMIQRLPNAPDVQWHLIKWTFFYALCGYSFVFGFDKWIDSDKKTFWKSRLIWLPICWLLWETGNAFEF